MNGSIETRTTQKNRYRQGKNKPSAVAFRLLFLRPNFLPIEANLEVEFIFLDCKTWKYLHLDHFYHFRCTKGTNECRRPWTLDDQADKKRSQLEGGMD